MADSAANSQAQDVPSKPSLQGDVSTDILENILDAYENPTYHFRLYMMSPEAVAKGKFNNQANRERIVIAESGVSPVDIDDVEIKTLGSISKEAGVGVATNFSFTLREPFGASLLDQIQRAGYFLGIQNFQKFPLFIELSFKGRRSSNDGLSNNADADHPLKSMVWTWPIQLTNMAMNVTAGGSTYSLEAVAYGDHAYSNQSSDLEKITTITTNTVGDFFTQLQQQLNAVEAGKAETSGYTAFDTYQFYVDSTLFNERIVPATEEELQNRSARFNEADGKMEFRFNAGTSIEKIIYNVLSLTKTFQNEIKGTEDPDSPGTTGGGEEAIYQKLWRIIADATPNGYDDARADYAKDYKYLIIPYDMTTLSTPSNIKANVPDPDRFDSYRNKGLIRKLYNYIYTGLNDQVFDFELNFNFNWFAALPIQGGLSTLANRAEPKGRVTQEQRAEFDFQGRKINYDDIFAASKDAAGFSPISTLEDAANAQFNAFFDQVETTTNKVNEATAAVSDAQASANAAANDALATAQNGIAEVPSPIAGIVQATSSPVINGAGSLVDRLTAGARPASRVSTSANSNTTDRAQKNLRSIDLQLDSLDVIEAANQRIQATIQEIKSKETDGQGYAAAPGQTLLSAMFEQAESPVAGDLLNIELRIKGDPYWLEPSPVRLGQPPTSIFRRLMANRGVNPDQALSVDSSVATNVQEQEEVTSANTAEQQTLIVFRSFTPQEFDPDTGLTPAGKKSTNVLNGVYAVREVTHSFSGGEFTQTLMGIRNLWVNLRNVDLDAKIRDNPEDTAEESTIGRTDQQGADNQITGPNALNVRNFVAPGEETFIGPNGVIFNRDSFGDNPFGDLGLDLDDTPVGPTPPPEE